jgi:hypothetical protein
LAHEASASPAACRRIAGFRAEAETRGRSLGFPSSFRHSRCRPITPR